MNTLELIKDHRSIRHFTEEKISTSTLHTLIEAGKAASSSSFIQCVSVIRITESALRESLMELCSGQIYVKEAAEFLVFCVDFHRHQGLYPEAKLGFIEQLMTGCIDVALFAQNLTLAAESLGYGAVYIGALHNHPLEVCEKLKLPKQTFPLFGLCLGKAESRPEIKPRLPNEVILHENQYHEITEPQQASAIEAYDQTLLEYLQNRSHNPRVEKWTQSISHKLSKEARPFMKEALEAQGFSKH